MQVLLNGAPREILATTLSALLEEVGLSGRVATAVNEEFIPEALRANHELKAGDRIEVLAPMQGG